MITPPGSLRRLGGVLEWLRIDVTGGAVMMWRHKLLAVVVFSVAYWIGELVKAIASGR